MRIELARQRKLAEIQNKTPPINTLKRLHRIAVIDDNPFGKTSALSAHNFQLAELGDIRRIDQVAEYPIVICDIRGVGAAFDSPLEGAHVIAEIRKQYPDKFLVAYSGAESDMSYNHSLKTVDASVTKDARTEVWVSVLEQGLKEVGDPLQRWIRFRNQLSMQGVEAYELYRLEQAYLKSLETGNSRFLAQAPTSGESNVLVKEFARIALAQLIKAGAAAVIG